ncbi:transposable element Tcb1 transposase [Trichonephila clavipes]|nr:transposable element Tcb1 transposase [Trichonephila clavipes]
MIFLRGRIIGRRECGRTQLKVSLELGIAQCVISKLWQRFQHHGNVSRCYSTGRRMRTGIFGSYCQKKQADHSIRPVSSANFSYQNYSFKAGHLQTFRAHWSICSASGTLYHQENTFERHRYGGAGWLVWGGSILASRTDLHVQSVTMTGHIYPDVILEPHVRFFRGAMGAEFLFMDDNARPHRANMPSIGSYHLYGLAGILTDLNPIEHVWDMLGR